ncbi:hypothetical protein E2C01_095474 [Portunus trituberculatus]|uniref:Uncharacterized protein n=1 Tax=Portunus trituberculatus TaxID=210409 RepID=A0A5B7JZH6_PORTR|nr:hypothetical protein [Portunus trituberculatus]
MYSHSPTSPPTHLFLCGSDYSFSSHSLHHPSICPFIAASHHSSFPLPLHRSPANDST